MSTHAVSYEELDNAIGKRLLYNPGERFSRDLGGETYWFPSKDETYLAMLTDLGKTRWLTPADRQEYERLPRGVRPITDMITQKNGGNQTRTREVITVPVDEAIKYLLGDDRRSSGAGRAGVRQLFGTMDHPDSRDALVIREANEVYAKKLYADALLAVAAHSKQRQKEREAGLPMSPPTPELLKHYQTISRVNAAGVQGPVCDVCSWPTSSDAELAQHKKDIHALEMKPTPEPVVGEEAGELEAPVKRGPGRPRKVLAEPTDIA